MAIQTHSQTQKPNPNNRKVPKPNVSESFPLSWHKGTGQWLKKINGKQYYFGSNPQKALQAYHMQCNEAASAIASASASVIAPAHAPTIAIASTSVSALVNAYTEHRKQDRDSAKTSTNHITDRTFAEYVKTGNVMQELWNTRSVESLQPLDFAMLRHVLGGSAIVLRRRMTCVRTIFKWGRSVGMLSTDARYGSEFDLANKSQIRKANANKQKPLFDASTILKAIAAATKPMKAFILLGINCGYYSKDISDLRSSYIDGEFIQFAREKTGIDRRCWLWKETREAIAAAKAPANAENRLFLSKRGKPLQKPHGGMRTDLIASAWCDLKKKIGLKREQSGFKCFRHTFRTEAGGCKDMEAVRMVMGHADSGIDEYYRHRFDDARLIAVAEYVHKWLYGE